MRAGVRDEKLFTVATPAHRPRSRRAGIDVVEQNGVEEFQLREVNDAARVAVDPTTLDLRRRQMKAREDVSDDSVASIRRNTDFTEQRAAVWQRNFLEHLARGDVDDTHAGRDDINIRPARVDVIDDEKALAIRRNGNGERLTRHSDAPDFLAARESDDAHVVVESVADVERSAIGTEHWRLRLIARWKPFDDFAFR